MSMAMEVVLAVFDLGIAILNMISCSLCAIPSREIFVSGAALLFFVGGGGWTVGITLDLCLPPWKALLACTLELPHKIPK